MVPLQGRSASPLRDSRGGCLYMGCGAGHLPRGLAVFEAKRQGVSALHHFAGQSQVRSILLDLGARNFKFVVGFEHYAHVVEKLLWAEENFDGTRTALHHQVGDRFSAGWRNELELFYDSLELAFRGGIVFGWRL